MPNALICDALRYCNNSFSLYNVFMLARIHPYRRFFIFLILLPERSNDSCLCYMAILERDSAFPVSSLPADNTNDPYLNFFLA
ncbi:hypothetical protein CW304_11975 [Bacillus sp. UFRGS-B20]|nr:hypothetical protein CW304_11975 [Bacillus sp. UFRGS-B20]